jgi:hypothetical protein
LGSGSDSSSRAPVPVAGGLRFASLEAANSLVCGLTTEGALYCWGWSDQTTEIGRAFPSGVAVRAPTAVRP